ncbi:hypothetical protein Tco_1399749 [Tanacetum coccineum]
MTPDEGTTKTSPCPEGSLGDKYLEGNIPPIDMELIHTPVADPSGTGAKYQVDETQSTRLSDEEVLAVGDDMYEDPQDDAEVKTSSPGPNQPDPSHVQESASNSSSPDLKKFDNTLPLTERQLIKYLRKTDKLVEASMSSLDRSSTTISDLYKGLNVITELLKTINIAQEEASTAWMKSSTNMAWNLGSRMSGVELSQTALKREISSLKKDTSKTKSIMTEMYAAFQENTNTTATEEPPSHTEGETKEPKLAIPILSIPSTAIPPTQAQPITSIIIHPERSQATPNIDKGKGIATESDDDPLNKLVKASFIVCLDPDKPVRVEFMINGKIVYLTEQEIQDYWDKEEQIKKVEEEAKLLAMTKPEVIKVVQEEAEKIGLDPKAIKVAKAGEMFKKAQDAEHAVLKRQHTEKVRKSLELKKPKYDSYMWTVSGRLKPEPITNIKIHPKTKPVIITVYKGNNGRNFKVHEPFLFGAFGISKLDELREIIPKKKNVVVKDLMNSLSRRYKRLQQIPSSSGKKRKHMELEPKTRIPGLECNQALPKNVSFVNNMIIKEPEYGIFFTDEFGDQAFQRWSDINKVGMEALVSYLVATSMVKSPENARFSIKLRKLIAEHPDQEKLRSKKVKLEALGYKMD